MKHRVALEDFLRAETGVDVPDAVRHFATMLADHFGRSTVAVLFYGAGLRRGIDATTLLDFYVVVDDVFDALGSRIAAVAATLLPPNVYLIEADGIKGKVAVIGRLGFTRGMRAFAPHLWARFAQPTAIIYARDEVARTEIIVALADAVTTLVATTPFTGADLWTCAFRATYACELRPESPDRAAALVAHAPERYAALAAVIGIRVKSGVFTLTRFFWWARRVWGKFLNLLRLMKAAFTFAGGLDYAVAKIEQHAGVAVAVNERDRKRPLRAGIRIFLEALRRGGVR